MSTKPKFKVGDMVQSHYRAKYHGVIEKIENTGRTGKPNWVCHIRPVWTADGRPMKTKVQRLHELYLTPSEWPSDNVNNVIRTTVTVMKKEGK